MLQLRLIPTFLHDSFPESRQMLIGQVLMGEIVVLEPVDLGLEPQAFPQARVLTRTKSPSKFLRWGLNLLIGLSLIVAAVLFVPSVYYHFVPADTQPVKTAETGTPLGGDFDQGSQVATAAAEPVKVLPPQDLSLPEGTWVVIPRIGVRTQLDPALSAEQALAKGVWMAPDYGVPGDTTKPIILAAHRFGWQWWWQTDYWKYHSFYLLPELQPGDVVEVTFDQRKYYYEIYAGEEGQEITDYNADMILYTCKFLNSPLRHFRYARMIDPTQNSQG